MKLAGLVLLAVALIYGALLLAGAAPNDVLATLFRGTWGSPKAIEGALKECTPLLMAGLAVFLGLRAGLFNIGVEGQFSVGALACAVIALRIPGPIGMGLGTLGGAIMGALWAWPAGWIKAHRGGHEVITTIMLNNVAVQLTTLLVAGRFKDPAQQGTTTSSLGPSSHLPSFGAEPRISLALVLCLGGLFGFWIWLRRTVAGYELEAVGASPKAASLAGVDAKRVIMRAMVTSGAIGGVAGALQVLAYEGRFFAGFSSGYGFDALGVALLAGSHPLAILPSALLFGMLNKGSTTIQVMHGVPKGISYVVLGLLIVVFAAFRYRRQAMREAI